MLHRMALLMGSLAMVGCERAAQPAELPPLAEFDSTRCGSIVGEVRWEGELPEVAPFALRTHGHYAFRKLVGRTFANPNVPVVNKGKVAGAIICLTGVDSNKARPWDLPPVTVEHDEYAFRIRQGDSRSSVGFVRAGDTVTFVSLQDTLDVLRVRGAAFYGIPLAEPRVPAMRAFRNPGLVEVTSGVGYYWMRGYLFVSAHPYITRTDENGRFSLNGVPAGEYTLSCWLPNWHVHERQREPEAGLINRVHFARPVSLESRVSVRKDTASTSEFLVYQELFDR